MSLMYGCGWKAFALLVFVVCFAPGNNVEGLQCLSCSSEEKSPNYDVNCGTTEPANTEDCPATAAGCSFTVESDERYIKRGCMATSFVTCLGTVFKSTLKEGQCVNLDSLTASGWERFGDCETEQNNKVGDAGKAAVASAPGSEAEAKGAEGASDGATPGGGQANKETVMQGPGSRIDITKMEICFCKGDKCNSNKIQPKSVLIVDAESGAGAQSRGALILTMFASGTGLGWKWIR